MTSRIQAAIFLFVILLAIVAGRMITMESPTFFIAALGAIVFMILSFFRPDVGLFVVIVSTLLLPGLDVGTTEQSGKYYMGRPVTFRYEDAIIMIAFLGWGAQSVIQKVLGQETRLPRVPINNAILFFTLAALLSTVVGIGMGTTTILRGGLFFVKRLEYFLVFFMTYHILKNVKDIRFFLIVFLCTSAAVVGVGAFQIATTGGGLVFSTFTGVGANPLASFCLILMPLLACVFFYTRRSTLKVVFGTFFVFTFIIFIFTRSRGGYISFIFTLIAFLWTTRKALWIIFPLLLMTPVLYKSLPKSVQQEFSSIESALPGHLRGRAASLQQLSFAQLASVDRYANSVLRSNIDPSWRQRVVAAVLITKLISKSPIVGGGLGSVELAYVDNQYALDLASLGFFGAILFLMLLYKIFRFLLDVYRRSLGANLWIFSSSVGMLCGFAGMLVHGLTVTNFYTIRTMVPFWFLLGILAVGHRLLMEDDPEALEAEGY